MIKFLKDYINEVGVRKKVLDFRGNRDEKVVALGEVLCVVKMDVNVNVCGHV